MKTNGILIVEDEGIVAIDLKIRLNHMGYPVIGIAKRGDQAILMAGERQPALVLMDVRLQGEMDGIETAAQIRSRFGTPVIFLTALNDADTRQRADKIQPADYLSKPFDDETLRRTVENVLSKFI